MSNDIEDIVRMVEDIQAQLNQLKHRLEDLGPMDIQAATKEKAAALGETREENSGTVVEGVFDGQNMVGPDGKNYTIPANYASKSKLVEGDIMKLTIKPDGSFIYKQIGPVHRIHAVGELVQDSETGQYSGVLKNGKSFRLLTASVTYYKGEPGQAVTMLLPEDMDSTWAAVDAVMPRNSALHESMWLEDHEAALLDSGADMELASGVDAELPSATHELPEPQHE